MKQTKLRLVAIMAALIVGALLVAGQASADHRGGERDPADLPASCFATGIDALISDFESGVELWEGCLTDDYSFEFIFFPGAEPIVCPGPGCPIQDFSSRAELRALFASENFEASGYLATQHQLLNVAVDQTRRSTATVSAYIQANHFLNDNSVDIFWGDYIIEAVRNRGRWKVRHEVITGTSFLNFAGAPIGGG